MPDRVAKNSVNVQEEAKSWDAWQACGGSARTRWPLHVTPPSLSGRYLGSHRLAAPVSTKLQAEAGRLLRRIPSPCRELSRQRKNILCQGNAAAASCWAQTVNSLAAGTWQAAGSVRTGGFLTAHTCPRMDSDTINVGLKSLKHLSSFCIAGPSLRVFQQFKRH